MLPNRRLLLPFALLAAACSPSCSGADGPDTTPQPPIILFAVDGFEWNVILPMLHEGRLPNLAALMERGVFGQLPTIEPTISPVIWTTIATGKHKDEHGIHDFVRRAEHPGEETRLYSNLDRKTKAFWNIASDYGKRVAIVGWWMTYPAEPVNGLMVAQTNTVEQLDIAGGQNVWKGALVEGVSGQVFPGEYEERVFSLLRDIEGEMDRRLVEIFGEFPHPLSMLGRRLWDNCRWSFRADAAYVHIVERVQDEGPFDLIAVYLGGPDVVGHRFWRYRSPALYRHPPSQESVENFENIIEDYYAYVDEAIGRLVARAGDARVLVVSDHGMGPFNLEKHFDPNAPPTDVNSAHHKQAQPGVVIAAGPDILRREGGPPVNRLERDDIPVLASVLQIAPTVLLLMDIPLAHDFSQVPSGDIIRRSFIDDYPVRWVPTHDSSFWVSSHQDRFGGHPDAEARMEQLRELGYIGD